MKKILIIQTAFIGDVVLSTPVAEKLHHAYPGAQIDFLLRKGNEEIFANHPFLNKVIVWNKKKNKYRNLLNILKQVRQNRYDLAVNINRFGSSGFITAFSKAACTAGFSKNPFSLFFSRRVKHNISRNYANIHEIDRNLSLVSGHGENIRLEPRLYPSVNDFKKTADMVKGDYICIAPASVWFTKQFPKEKWIEFIRKINPPLQVFLLGSEKDKEYCGEIKNDTVRNNCINFAGRLSLLETAALMKNAKMNFANDSAPVHIASAMNAPVTAIFCSTVPAFGFGPLSGNSYIIETEKQLECRPCGLHGLKNCPQNHFECAYSINSDKLLEKIIN